MRGLWVKDALFWGSAIMLGVIGGCMMPSPQQELRDQLREAGVRCLTLKVYLNPDPIRDARDRLALSRRPEDLCALEPDVELRAPENPDESIRFFAVEDAVREMLQ